MRNKEKKGKILAIFYLLLFLLSFLPITPVSALVWNTGVTFTCGNEYWSVTTALTVDNITVGATWISVNGIGFNVSHPSLYIYNNFSAIQSYPKTTTGYIVNWTQQKNAVLTTYTFSGLKATHDYILYSNGTGTTHSTDASGAFSFSSAITSTNRLYKIFDPGIPGDWYVATTGSDSTGTGSIGNPFKTIQKAINASSTGDTIYIRGGTYTPYTTVYVNRSGTAGDYFTISGYPGETVIVNGSNGVKTNYLNGFFQLDNRDYVRLTNFTIEHAAVGGISLRTTSGDCTYIMVDHIRIMNSSSFAFKSQSSGNDHIWFVNNTVYNSHNNWSGLSSGVLSEEAISISATTYFYILYNHIYNNRAENIDMKSGTALGYVCHNTINTTGQYIDKPPKEYWGGLGIYIDARSGIAHNITIAYNHCYGNISAIELNTETAGRYENISIYNNIINMTNRTGSDHTSDGRYCIQLNNDGGSSGIFKDIKIYSNTLNTGALCIHAPIWIKSAITNARAARINISNNIMTMNNKTTSSFAYYMIKYSGLTSTGGDVLMYGNLYYNKFASAVHRIQWSDGDWTSATPTKWGNSPLFVSPQVVSPNLPFNFHINLTSPCKGAATSTLCPSDDFDGVSRPQGGDYDIGALEYVAGGGTSYSPVLATEQPTNLSSSVVLPLGWLNITATDQNADNMNIYFRSNWTGAWTTLSSNLTVTNGTYRCILPGFTGVTTRKYWSVNATDSSTWTNRTYSFMPYYPTEGITLSGVKANWTTTTSINLTWSKGANTTNTYIYRSSTNYLAGAALIYSGTASYYNDTLKDPLIRYYYTLYPYNSISSVTGTPVNASLAETDNTSAIYTGSSWITFRGWQSTDKSMQTRFNYANSNSFTSTYINETALKSYYFNGTAPGESLVYGSSLIGQRFQTGADYYYLYNVNVKARKQGSPGMFYCYLYAVGADLLPTGAALSTGSTNANLFTSSYPGSWYNITMSTYNLTGATNYAIVFDVPVGTAANHVKLGMDDPGTYANSQYFYSTDDGVTYTNNTAIDLYFKIWGRRSSTLTTASTSNTTRSTTGAFGITQTGLGSGWMYYYREAANDTHGNMTRGNVRFTLTNPGIPTFMYMVPVFTNNSLHVSWTKGVGANRTVIVDGGGSYPVDAADGIILYNGTGTDVWFTSFTFNTSHSLSLFGFTIWGPLSRWSSPATIPWGGCTFIVRNESAPWQLVNATIMVTDSSGLHPVYFTNVYGYYSFNISQIPYGENTRFYVSNISYSSRLYVYDLEPDVFYNLTFYLPPLHPPGWNTTSGNATASYLIQVIDEQELPIQGAVVQFYRYLNYTGNYTYIGGFVSDGNGQGSISLFPYQLYMIKITCDGYQNITDFWIPNVVEQSLYKYFKLYYEVPDQETKYDFMEQVHFTATLNNATGLLTVTYADDMAMTENLLIVIYDVTNGTIILSTGTLLDTFTTSVVVNNTHDYEISWKLNHTFFGYKTGVLYLTGWHATITTMSKFNLLFTINFGFNPFGWSNVILWFILLGCFFSFNRRDTWMVMFLIGFLALFINYYIGFNTALSVIAGGAIPIVFIFFGLLMLIRDRHRFGVDL